MAKVGYGAMYGFFIAFVTIVLSGLFVYKSVRPVMRLRDDPPAEFFDAQPKWTAARRQAEARLARAYWTCAVRLSQGQYSYGERLPDEPPPGFSIDPKANPAVEETPAAARARYWRNLQKVWLQPGVWRRLYEWHTDWFFRSSNY
jgi:hypothetical protein